MQVDFDTFKARLLEAIGAEPMYSWAERVGINKSTLNGCMTRKSIPKPEFLCALCDNLGCSIDWLLGRTDGLNAAVPQDDDLLVQALQATDRALNELGELGGKAVPADVRATLTLFAKDVILAKGEARLVDHFRRLLRLLPNEPKTLTPDEAEILSTYRASSEAKRQLMRMLARKKEALSKAA